MKYEFTDTHTHLYLKEFREDIDHVIDAAFNSGVTRMFLPNLDTSTIEGMMIICKHHKGKCFPMIGLHPTSVRADFEGELALIKEHLNSGRFIAIGETGIDLYWDRTYIEEQKSAFRQQVKWAKQTGLPLVIHARDSFDEIFEILDTEADESLKGVFHSFTGNLEQLKKILSYNFHIGINGIVTFKNSGLDKIVESIPKEKLLIETDAPFLAPVPFRGKRNESSYVIKVAEKIAEIYGTDLESVAGFTTSNALNLFKKAI